MYVQVTVPSGRISLLMTSPGQDFIDLGFRHITDVLPIATKNNTQHGLAMIQLRYTQITFKVLDAGP